MTGTQGVRSCMLTFSELRGRLVASQVLIDSISFSIMADGQTNEDRISRCSVPCHCQG